MNKKIYLLFYFLITFNSLVQADNSSLQFYKDIGRSISTANGNVILYFSEGRWLRTIENKKVIIRFSEDQKATFKFSYLGGNLQEGSTLTFDPKIHIWVKAGNRSFSFSVEGIKYDDLGKWDDWVNIQQDNPQANNLNHMGAAKESVRLNFNSEKLFEGKILKNFSVANRSDRDGNIVESGDIPCLKEVIIKKPNETESGLAVSFIPNSTIHFSSDNYQNLVSVNSGSFEFRYLQYDVVNRYVECEISQFDINVQSGFLQTKDLLINVSSNSRFKFTRVQIVHDANTTEINAERGNLNLQIRGGTKITLFNSNPSELTFENGEINLFDFSYFCSNNENVFRIGGGSTLNVTTRSGMLAFGDRGYLSIASGRLESMLHGTWNSQAANPDAHLNITLFQVSLDGGKFPFFGENILGVRSGSIKSESLRFDGLTFSSCVGEIRDLTLVVDDESRFSIPNGMKFKIKEGGVINGAEPNHPLRFDIGKKFATGLFKFDLKYSTFSNSSNETVNLTDGTIKMKLEIIDMETIRGNGIQINGLTKIVSQGIQFSGYADIYDGNLEYIIGQQPTLNSKFKFRMDNGEVTYKTPFIRDGDNIRLFPVNLRFSLSEQIISQPSNLSFVGNNITLDQQDFNAKFNLEIPRGNGEHQNRDDENSDDGRERGPAWSRDCQEVLFYDSPICDGHLYVYPQSIQFSARISLGINDQRINFSLSGFEFDSTPRWEKDGCELPIIGAIAGNLGGLLLGGGLGQAVGTCLGVYAGIRGEHIVEDRIRIGIAEATTKANYHGQWRFSF